MDAVRILGPHSMRLGHYATLSAMFRRPPSKPCRARRRDGGHCGNRAVRGKNVCRIHGGLSPGRQGPRDVEHMRKVRAGSQRWYLARRVDKAAGLPVRRMGRIPGRRRGEPIEVSRARVVVNDAIAARVAAPFGELPMSDKLRSLTNKALDTFDRVLDMPADEDPDRQLKIVRLQLEAAISVTNTQIKVDDAELRAEQRADWLELLRAKMEAARAELPAPASRKEPKL
jgi:hypothetical protein